MKSQNKTNKVKNKKIKSIKFYINKFINSIVKFYNKKIVKNGNNFSMKEVVFMLLITFFFGMIIGGVIMFGKGSFNSGISSSLNEFIDTYEDILETYYEEIDSEELLESGIEGMIDYLDDPYASYMNATEADSFNEQVQGEYSGIGAEIKYDYATGIVKIGKVFENSPAATAGLKTEDVLLEVNGESIKELETSEIAAKVKGKTGTNVKVKIKRGEEEKVLVITRGKVDIESVETKMYERNNKKVGYISISIFASNTYSQFKDKLEKLEKEKIDSLIIDVRGNSGGYLTTVTEIISLFTTKDSVIYQLKTKGEIEKIKDKTDEKREYPIYVLVNGASASASEVLSSTLKENYGATIVGTRTYGKGKVQKAYSLSNGATIKYTFQEWLTPNGNSIDGVGVEPDNVIEYVYDGTDKDNQLEEALKEISK